MAELRKPKSWICGKRCGRQRLTTTILRTSKAQRMKKGKRAHHAGSSRVGLFSLSSRWLWSGLRPGGSIRGITNQRMMPKLRDTLTW